jgi:hypothetical protein
MLQQREVVEGLGNARIMQGRTTGRNGSAAMDQPRRGRSWHSNDIG